MSQLKNKYLADDAVTARNIADEVISNIHISPMAAIEYSKLDLTGQITFFDLSATVATYYARVTGNALVVPMLLGTTSAYNVSLIANGNAGLTLRQLDTMLQIEPLANIEKPTGDLSISVLAGDLFLAASSDISIDGAVSLILAGGSSTLILDTDTLLTSSVVTLSATTSFTTSVNGNNVLSFTTPGAGTFGYVGYMGTHTINGNTLSIVGGGATNTLSMSAPTGYSDVFSMAINSVARTTIAAVGVAGAFIDSSLVFDTAILATGRLLLATSPGQVDIKCDTGSVTVGDISIMNQTHRVNGALQHYGYDGTNTQGSDRVLGKFLGVDNVVSPANVTGLTGLGSESFRALVKVFVDATTDLYESFIIHAVKKGSVWELTDTAVGDDSLVLFSITGAGQVQYVSGIYTGFSSLTISWINERLL